jgi:hypothetical protein
MEKPDRCVRSRMRHVGSLLFAVVLCRKFAVVTTLFRHLPRHKNIAAIKLPAARHSIFLIEELFMPSPPATGTITPSGNGLASPERLTRSPGKYALRAALIEPLNAAVAIIPIRLRKKSATRATSGSCRRQGIFIEAGIHP